MCCLHFCCDEVANVCASVNGCGVICENENDGDVEEKCAFLSGVSESFLNVSDVVFEDGIAVVNMTES